MPVSVRPVAGRRDLTEFIRFPGRLHRDSPCYVAPLEHERRIFFSPTKNPFHEHAAVAQFLARDGRGEVVGRITGHIDWNYVRFHDERTGFFGFFDSVDDGEVARELLGAAESFLRSHGMVSALGPMSFSTNDEVGVLVKGFSSPPCIMMPFNHPYYDSLLQGCGYAPQRDLYAYYLENNGEMPAFLRRAAGRARRSGRITIRHIELRNFQRELALVKEIYNSAWERNWGFVPMTDAEIDFLAKSLKPLVDPDVVFFAFVDGAPAGLFIGLPDFNVVLKKLNGRLFPFGIFRFLLERRKIDRLRVLVLGVRREFRGLGVEAVLLEEIFTRGMARGFKGAELSWILEDNDAMNRIIGRLTPEPYRVYRVYGRDL